MGIYLSLLRGINVSGQKKIKMADLKQLYESLGYQGVTTYIQSGNVIFETAETDMNELKQALEKAIRQKYGFFVPVEVRINRQLHKIIADFPYDRVHADEDGKRYLITFLSELPDQSKIDHLQRLVTPPERLTVKGREVYLHCPESYGKSKLSNNFIEAKLGISATTRNWKSVIKLHELMNTKEKVS